MKNFEFLSILKVFLGFLRVFTKIFFGHLFQEALWRQREARSRLLQLEKEKADKKKSLNDDTNRE